MTYIYEQVSLLTPGSCMFNTPPGWAHLQSGGHEGNTSVSVFRRDLQLGPGGSIPFSSTIMTAKWGLERTPFQCAGCGNELHEDAELEGNPLPGDFRTLHINLDECPHCGGKVWKCSLFLTKIMGASVLGPYPEIPSVILDQLLVKLGGPALTLRRTRQDHVPDTSVTDVLNVIGAIICGIFALSVLSLILWIFYAAFIK